MAYFYVKKQIGTRIAGGGLTKQTGTFAALGAANVYANVAAAVTDGATNGDIVCVSDLTVDIVAPPFSGPATGEPLHVVSVDDAACDTYKRATAAQMGSTGSNSYNSFAGMMAHYGMWYQAGRYGGLNGNWASHRTYETTHSQLTSSASYYPFSATGDGQRTILRGSDIIGQAATFAFNTRNSKIEMYGGSVAGSTNVAGGFSGEGGGFLYLYGVDLSACSNYVILNVGAATADCFQVELRNCKMHPDVQLLDETILRPDNRLIMTGCSSDSDAAEYQYLWVSKDAQVEDDTSIYRDGSTAFPSGQKISLKCTTLATANAGHPFTFDFPTRYAQFSNAASDTLRIYLLTSATLYDSDVWAEVVYPDGTTKQLANFISTTMPDILDTTGTALTTNTESWTGRTAENQYHIDIDTSTDPGADCVPTIRVYVAKPSATIYFCTSVDVI